MVVSAERGTWALAGDVLALLERMACESIPPFRDDKAADPLASRNAQARRTVWVTGVMVLWGSAPCGSAESAVVTAECNGAGAGGSLVFNIVRIFKTRAPPAQKTSVFAIWTHFLTPACTPGRMSRGCRMLTSGAGGGTDCRLAELLSPERLLRAGPHPGYVQDADEYSKDYVERDEQRLTELGRRAVEMFAAAHIFAALQEAHSEAESIKRQDALIQEVRRCPNPEP